MRPAGRRLINVEQNRRCLATYKVKDIIPIFQIIDKFVYKVLQIE